MQVRVNNYILCQIVRMTKEKQQTPAFIYDRLYGQIEFDNDELRLFQTKELARLRQVSSSAIPTWTIPTGVCASKFEHTIGVAHLAKIVGKRPEFEDISKDLYFAALAHDLGTPPFSHASEYFLINLYGKNHEEFTDDIVENSEFAKEVQKQGGNMQRVLNFVKGTEKPMSDLINGTIDIDNLDNTLRYGLSMGLMKDILYSPEKLARAYAIRNGQLVLLSKHTNGLQGWEKTRMDVYDFVYGGANLSTGSMLFRALDFATKEGEIKREYFTKTDAEAFGYLLHSCNTRTHNLMDRANRWIFYARVYNYASSEVTSEIVSLVMNSNNRGLVADEISKLLKIPPEDVCVYMGKNKSFKQIHLPIITNGENKNTYKPQNKLTYMAQVYIHPKWVDKSLEIQEYMQDRINHHALTGMVF